MSNNSCTFGLKLLKHHSLEKALTHCRKHLGGNATILYDLHIPALYSNVPNCGVPSSIESMVKEQGKEAGGPWDCYNVFNYYGWEAERVIVVTTGSFIMEAITRARTHLIVILVDGTYGNLHAKVKGYFQRAEDQGLVEIVQIAAKPFDIKEEYDDINAADKETVDETKLSCSSGCCTS